MVLLLWEKGRNGGLGRRHGEREKGMGVGDRKQLWEKESWVLSPAVPCKGRVGSPCALLPERCSSQCQQPTPSLRDNKCCREDNPAAEPCVVSHAGLSDNLFWAPHTAEKLLTATAVCSVTLLFIIHILVYIPHILTMKAEQIEHVNHPPFSPVIPLAFVVFFPTLLKAAIVVLTDQSSSVSIYTFFPLFPIGEASSTPLKRSMTESITLVTNCCVRTNLLSQVS